MRRETEDKGTILHQYHQERCSTSLVNPASMTHGLKLRPTDTLVRVIIYFPNDILYFRFFGFVSEQEQNLTKLLGIDFAITFGIQFIEGSSEIFGFVLLRKAFPSILRH
mmetsp:Transcript_3060/g.11416  ORF Transcript_3060/g.11416 Transcript_3060/m.11416 type:complete len:109 (-) Transcript_3060:300-626(-)